MITLEKLIDMKLIDFLNKLRAQNLQITIIERNENTINLDILKDFLEKMDDKRDTYTID